MGDGSTHTPDAPGPVKAEAIPKPASPARRILLGGLAGAAIGFIFGKPKEATAAPEPGKELPQNDQRIPPLSESGQDPEETGLTSEDELGSGHSVKP